MQRRHSNQVVAAAALLGWMLWVQARAQDAPANDNFADRIPISGPTNQVRGSNIGATRENGEPGHANAPASKSVWWTWTASATGNVTVSTAGSDFDTVLGVYTGDQYGSLRVAASNDDCGRDETSLVVFRALAGTAYQIAVDGYLSATGHIVLSIGTFGFPAPKWALPDVIGQPVVSTEFQGKVMIVNFWYTTCGPCVDEIPGLVNLYEQYRDDGLVVVGISIDAGGPSVVGNFMENYRMTYPVVMTDHKVDGDFGGVPIYPTSFIIDRQNQVVGTHVGARDRQFFEQEILPLLYSDLKLDLRQTAGRLVVSWPLNRALLSLEQCGDLSMPNWAPLTDVAPQTNGGVLSVTLPAAERPRFFRLKK